MAVQSLELQISDNAEKAAAHVARLAAELNRLNNAVRPGSIGALASRLKQISGETSAGAMGKMAEMFSEATKQMELFSGAIERAATALTGLNTGSGSNAFRDVADGARQAADAMDSIGAGTGPLGGMVNLDSATESAQEFTDAVKDANGEMVTLASETQQAGSAAGAGASGQEEFADATREAADAAGEENAVLKSLKDSIAAVGKRLGGLFSSFTRIARFRLFRTVIRAITTAFKEGMENVREYSKAINGLYAKDMAGLDNAVLKMKNSLGASLAVAFQALLPIIHQFISAIIDAANVFNQFMALLNGHGSWTKAVDVVASDFEDAKKKATGAAKAAKNLLASWDELNIIQSQSSGGGSGSNKLTAEDYKKMFEESFHFEGWIKETVDFMESHLPIVQGLLAGIAGLLLGIKDIGVITVAIGLVTTIGNAKDIAKNGFTMENIQTAAIGALEMALGGAFLGAKSGIPGGVLIGVVTGLAVAAIISLVADFRFRCEKGEIGDAIADGLGITATSAIAGAALGMIAGQPLIGAVAGAAVGVLITLVAAFTVDKNARDRAITVSDQELDDYVATHMFESDVRVRLKLIGTVVDNVEDARHAIQTTLSNMDVTLYGLRLGINKKENYDKLVEEIFGPADANGKHSGGLMGQIQTYANSQKTMIQTSFTLMPSGDTTVDASLLNIGITGWTEVEAYTRKVGAQLGDELSKGFTEDGLANFDEELVDALTRKLTNVFNSVARFEMQNEAYQNLILNLRSDKMTDAEAFAQYNKELEEGHIRLQLQTYGSYQMLAGMFRNMALDNPDQADLYNAKATELENAAQLYKDVSDEAVAAAVREYSEPGRQFLIDRARRETKASAPLVSSDQKTLIELITGRDEPKSKTQQQWDVWARGYAATSEEVLELANAAKKLDIPFTKAINEFAHLQTYGGDLLTDQRVDYSADLWPWQFRYDLSAEDILTEEELSIFKSVYGIDDNSLPNTPGGGVDITCDDVQINTGTGSQYSTPDEDATDPQMTEANSKFTQMITLLTAIRDKNFTVNITPSANLGRVVTESQNAWGRASGRATNGVTSMVGLN